MTNKKRRQRGSRTHGGGTHKNRRGAGHRGGRGAAGRKKHERNLHGPLGKHGFTRPPTVQDEVAEVSVQKLDEDAALLAAEGLAEEEGDGYAVDARDVAEDGHDVDVVKVLGTGTVRGELHVTADAFTDEAVSLIEDAGGSVHVTDRAEEAEAVRNEDEAEAEDTQSGTEEA